MALLADEYLSVPGGGEGIYKDRGSRFIARAYPVETEDDVKAVLEVLRREFHDARHHCYAYRLGLKADRYRANDDGEPSGSAGRPILGQIDSAGLSDVAVIVVRYFGGIKLGIPGLIRAYKSATADALEKAAKCEKIAGSWMRLRFGYGSMPEVMKAVKDLGLQQRSQDFGLDCTLEVRVRRTLEQDFLEKTKNIPNFSYQKTE